MARNINDRLSNLSKRRKGLDRIEKVALNSRNTVLADAILQESYEKRATNQPATRYALGAMQEVGQKYTSICSDTAERVGKQLENKLTIPVTFKLQGSVPLNVHIRAVSDVDLLTLDNRFLTYDRHGSRANTYSYTPLNSLTALTQLRNEAEKVLTESYPAATVDCSGGKAISLSGGSLARPVDVVPSHWFDNAQYQSTLDEAERSVTILNKKVPETIENLPFLHIKKVHAHDGQCYGSLKKAIRLVKSVKSDSDRANSANLPSFDIAALLYHANQSALQIGIVYELAILAEAQRFFDWCHNNKDATKLLRTPDNTRTILNTEAKLSALTSLSIDLDELLKEVAREQSTSLGNDFSLEQGRAAIKTCCFPKPYERSGLYASRGRRPNPPAKRPYAPQICPTYLPHKAAFPWPKVL